MTSTQTHNQIIKNLIVFYEAHKRSPHSRKETRLFNYVCNIKRNKTNIYKHVDPKTAQKAMRLINKYDNSTTARMKRKTKSLISYLEMQQSRPHYKKNKELYNFMVKVMGKQIDLHKYIDRLTVETLFWYLEKYDSYESKPFGRKEIIQVINKLKKYGKVPSNTGRVYQVYKKLLKHEIDPSKFLNTQELYILRELLGGKKLEVRREYSEKDFKELYNILKESRKPHWKNERRLNFLMYDIKAKDSNFSHTNCSKKLLDKIIGLVRKSDTFGIQRYRSSDFVNLIQYLVNHGRPGDENKRMYNLLYSIEKRKVQPQDYISNLQANILNELIQKNPSRITIAKRKKKYQQKQLKQLIV